jgi:hypothetical protein
MFGSGSKIRLDKGPFIRFSEPIAADKYMCWADTCLSKLRLVNRNEPHARGVEMNVNSHVNSHAKSR